MRRVVHTISSVFLVLVIALTSVELAAARGQAPAVATMEICTGTGPVHILVDENGAPTGGVMICPDYAMAFFAEPPPPTPAALRIDTWCALWLNDSPVVSAEQAAPRSQARGPPATI
ncbi:hypothetical protein [Marivita sp. S2033]|uniref:hypothetical protein n=1 Tax=Marivita sp. S2033 TaxID=3373187 RepID=UPI00398274FB